jgi:hypothetical protein
MTKPKKPEPNPIEEAIGDRAKDPKAQEKFTKEYQTEPTPENNSPRTLRDVPDQPLTQSEMVDLEELNHSAEERLGDQYPEEGIPQETPTHVLEPDLPTVTTTSSPESPPQEAEADIIKEKAKEIRKQGQEEAIRIMVKDVTGITPSDDTVRKIINTPPELPAEDVELTNLKKYILEDGFVLATVAFHIVALCAQPMTTPSTTMWDFRDRANIPDMVLALLNQPGYIEGIWPSLKIVMGSNIGNSAWSAGISTTIAFFDVVRTLPALKELQNESNQV